MSPVLPESDGLYEEVREALGRTFGVERSAIGEDTPLRALIIEERHLYLSLPSFAQQMKIVLTPDDLCDVLGGNCRRPNEPPEEETTLIPRLLEITVIQIVAVVRNKLVENAERTALDDGAGEKW